MARIRASAQDSYKRFGDTFKAAYHPKQSGQLYKAVDSVLAEQRKFGRAELGHPEFVSLQAGESQTASAVVTFIDIRGFTKLSFVLDARELLRIVQALTEASINVITDGGGYIGEFTGDGVMAYFGDSTLGDDEATMAALETTSLLFKTVEEIVNPELANDGIDPIRIAAGMEYGEVLWSRIGTGESSQVKPVANATFLAGKLCSGNWAGAWECKIGGQFAAWVPDEYKKRAPQYGPYQIKGQQISRDLYFVGWRRVAQDSLVNRTKLEESIRNRVSQAKNPGVVVSAAKIVTPSSSNPSPRPLKDQTFFGEK